MAVVDPTSMTTTKGRYQSPSTTREHLHLLTFNVTELGGHKD